jgi:hypothetical protein
MRPRQADQIPVEDRDLSRKHDSGQAVSSAGVITLFKADLSAGTRLPQLNKRHFQPRLRDLAPL